MGAQEKVPSIILARLKSKGRSQAWLARELGVSQATVTNWLRHGEEMKMSPEQYRILINELDLTISELFGIEDAADKDPLTIADHIKAAEEHLNEVKRLTRQQFIGEER